MVIVERLGHADEVASGGKQDENVEYLMRAAPDVKCLRETSLRPSNRVEKRAENVQEPLEQNPVEPHTLLQDLVAVDAETVAHGHDPRDAEADEHGGAVGAPARRAELLDP